jgi:hypothetical protein
MLLESTEIINRPLEEVYNLVRDDLDKLVPYLPNVNKIDVVEKRVDGDKVHLTNHWYAVADMPSMLAKFIKPEILSWKDIAVWDDINNKVDYTLESFLANDLFDAKGTNTFTAVGDDKTELKLSCEVEIYADKVPGVPKLLAKKAKPMVEGLLEKILKPNLTSLGKGLNEYFANN